MGNILNYPFNDSTKRMPDFSKEKSAPIEASVVDEHTPKMMDKAEEARLLRKIDMRVLPMLFVIYVFAFLDR